MTDKEKARAYDKVVKRAKAAIDVAADKDLVGGVIRTILPELTESEDERIRKWIKKEIEDKYVVEGIVNNKLADKAFGWLEKQKHLYETTKDRFYREGFEEGQLYEKQKEQKPIKMEVYEVGKGTTVCGQDYKCKKDYKVGNCWYIKDAIYHCGRDGYLTDQNGVSWSCTPEWFNEYIQSNTEWAEEEKTRFVSGQFLQCKLSFDEFKEGEHYWLEYIGDDMYVGRSDNILNQKFHITPRQLYTLFSQQLEENEKEQDKCSEYCVRSHCIGCSIYEKQKEQKPSVFPPGFGEVRWNPISSVQQKLADEQFPPLEGLDAIKAKYYDDGFKNGFDEGVESVKSAEIDEYKIIKKHITEDVLSSEVNKRLKECGWYVTDEKPAEWSKEEKNRCPLNTKEIKVGDIITYFRNGKKGIMLVSSFDSGIYPRCKWGITDIDGTAYGDWTPGSGPYYTATEKEKQQLYDTMPIEVKNWFKSLCPQPKVELTLLDKNIIEAAVAFVELNNHFNCWRGIDKHTVIKALRSLKSQWKPTGEQMDALKDVAYGAYQNGDGPVLRGLYEQLKRLI